MEVSSKSITGFTLPVNTSLSSNSETITELDILIGNGKVLKSVVFLRSIEKNSQNTITTSYEISIMLPENLK